MRQKKEKELEQARQVSAPEGTTENEQEQAGDQNESPAFVMHM
jgi:hypothetical protein